MDGVGGCSRHVAAVVVEGAALPKRRTNERGAKKRGAKKHGAKKHGAKTQFSAARTALLQKRVPGTHSSYHYRCSLPGLTGFMVVRRIPGI